MDPLTTGLVAALAAVLVAVPAGYGLARLQDRSRQSSARYRASEVTDHARREAENIIKDSELKAKDELFKKREEFNREIERARTEVRDQERRLEKREDVLDQKHQAQLKKERALEHAQRKLNERREQVEKRSKELEVTIQEETAKLHEISTLTREQAERMLLERLEVELSDEVAAGTQKAEERFSSTAEEKACEGLIGAVQRSGAAHTADTTTSSTDMPSDDMK